MVVKSVSSRTSKVMTIIRFAVVSRRVVKGYVVRDAVQAGLSMDTRAMPMLGVSNARALAGAGVVNHDEESAWRLGRLRRACGDGCPMAGVAARGLVTAVGGAQ